MVHRRRSIRPQHTKEIETYAQPCPRIVALESHYQKHYAKSYTHDDATSMAPCIPKLFLICVLNRHLLSMEQPFSKIAHGIPYAEEADGNNGEENKDDIPRVYADRIGINDERAFRLP